MIRNVDFGEAWQGWANFIPLVDNREIVEKIGRTLCEKWDDLDATAKAWYWGRTMNRNHEDRDWYCGA